MSTNHDMVAAIDRLTEIMRAVYDRRSRQDPAEDWCEAIGKEGRCSRDSVKDGLCTTHWRMANDDRRRERVPRVRGGGS